MKTAVMTDTNSGITKQEADALGIFLMQMPVIIDGETHYEGLDLTHDSFFAALTAIRTYLLHSHPPAMSWICGMRS